MQKIPIIDLFAGPGGLGEGFSVVNGQWNPSPFEVVLSIENNPFAWETLSLRHLFRCFLKNYRKIPAEYYSFLAGDINREDLDGLYKKESKTAYDRSWLATLGEISNEEVDSRIYKALGKNPLWVLIGGPPCQAYSLVGRSRNKGKKDYVPEQDHRHYLYKEYLRILAVHTPPYFVMENVKGMLSSKLHGNMIFDEIISDLRQPRRSLSLDNGKNIGYNIYSFVSDENELSPADFVIRSEKYGIPQARHRVILFGVRQDLEYIHQKRLVEATPKSVVDVLQGLPQLRSGISRGSDSLENWQKILQEAIQSSWFNSIDPKLKKIISVEIQKTHGNELLREDKRYIASGFKFYDWYGDPNLFFPPNHSTRSHMRADLHRYLFAACFSKVNHRSPKLGDFPEALLPKHKNVQQSIGTGSLFSDRFKVQIEDQPSTTITSHIAKDGHYYIHPDPQQCRSLTVREAARLQTFPDNYFFCGPRTQQYHQVGNAVPPLLAKQIAERVLEAINHAWPKIV